jgi:hypothetical protein
MTLVYVALETGGSFERCSRPAMKPLGKHVLRWVLFTMATAAAAGLASACSSDNGAPANGQMDSGTAESGATPDTGTQDTASNPADSSGQSDTTLPAEEGGLDATTDAASDVGAPVDSSPETSVDAGVCANPAAACIDGMKDCQETDTDCGGPACVKCQNSKKCAQDSDCVSYNCVLYVCEPAPADAATEGG